MGLGGVGKEPPLTGITAYTGLAEVLFSSNPISGGTLLATTAPPAIPLPAGLPLMASALGIVAALRLRKRAHHA